MKKANVVLTRGLGASSSVDSRSEHRSLFEVIRELIRFWRHNGSGLDDYNRMTITIEE